MIKNDTLAKIHYRTDQRQLAKIVVILLLVSVSTTLAFATDVQVYPRLSVGAFGELGHQQGLAGGIRFSRTTFSVQGITDEAAMVVAGEDGDSALVVRSNGDVIIDKNLVVYGNKSFAHPHPEDPNKIITYISLEGGEAGVYTRGTARLTNGEATINLPEHFSLITNKNSMTIMLTPTGQWLQLYVVEKSPEHIIVREATHKDGTFDYLVQGIRKGYENYQVINAKE